MCSLKIGNLIILATIKELRIAFPVCDLKKLVSYSFRGYGMTCPNRSGNCTGMDIRPWMRQGKATI